MKDLAEAAEARVTDKHGFPTAYPQHRDWADCLTRLAGERGTINTKRLGRWLLNREGRVVERTRICKADKVRGGVWRWTIKQA